MPEVSSYQAGTPSWVELTTPDREKAMAFYRDLFGWDYEVGGPETGYYTQGKIRGLRAAGLSEPPPPESGMPQFPPSWTTYLATDDADATAAKITEAGGTLLVPPMDVLEFGRMVIASDPTGAVFGLWQAGKHTGAELAGEPGTLAWAEVVTRDTAAAREFYSTVFGYGMEDLPDAGVEYTTLKVGDTTVAGLLALAEGMDEIPPHWMAYFAVADCDETVGKATARGGQVLQEPFDTPYGRMAVLRDPDGAVFSVLAVTPDVPTDTGS